MLRRLHLDDSEFGRDIDELLEVSGQNNVDVDSIVNSILEDVKARGDAAVLEYTNKFDKVNCEEVGELLVDSADMQLAAENLDPLVKDALQLSINRVRDYHLKQKQALGNGKTWSFQDDLGNTLGQRVNCLDRVGVYAPGGKAAYPSSIVMTVIPAIVAGVSEIILCIPAPGGELKQVILATAHLCGVTKIFKIGGAQAVAAMAFGTALVPKVDKIVGPGNIYVATAKKIVFGEVGIDMIAGPSEVVIVADSTTNPDWLAMDMFAQAEHDELAQSILISEDSDLLDAVAQSIERLLPDMERADIIRKSLDDRGALILVPDLDSAASLVNKIAPEHLELALANAEEFSTLIRHAGAIFIGRFSAEAIGDYTAGPSHVLPTSGTARFASPLGVEDFQVKTSIIHCTEKGAIDLSRAAAIIANEEGLEAHGRSAEFRFQG